MQEYLVANDGVGGNLHVREQTVLPISFHGIGYIGARYGYVLSDRES